MRDICGRYRLVRRLGEGGTGTVYQAVDLVLGRTVAVKMLHDASLDPRPEARSLAQLSHPNVVALHDIVADGDESYLVMEYVEGVSLQALLAERGPLALPRAIEIVRQIGAVLTHAHQRGVLHCDLTPANVLLSTSGEVKLLDFTLARVLDRGRFGGRAGGSGSFAAPEQFGGETGPFTDVYGLGALLRHLIAPRPGTRSPVSDFDPALERDTLAMAAIERATALAPADRFPTIEDFLAALPDSGDITRVGSVAPLANLTRVLPDGRTPPRAPSRRPLVALCATLALLMAAISAHFTVFASPARVTVPNLVAGSARSARVVATSLDLRVHLRPRYAAASLGAVLAQQPAAGSAVAKGSLVTIVVSKGPAPVIVPNLLGLSQSVATSTLDRSDLRISVRTQDTISQPAGVVLAQNPASPAALRPGSAVTITISEKPWWWIF